MGGRFHPRGPRLPWRKDATSVPKTTRIVPRNGTCGYLRGNRDGGGGERMGKKSPIHPDPTGSGDHIQHVVPLVVRRVG